MRSADPPFRVLFTLIALLVGVCVAWGGQGVGTPSVDVTVNTKGWLDPELVVSIHRLTNEAYKNAGPNAGIDKALTVKPDRDILGRQPEIGLIENIPVISVSFLWGALQYCSSGRYMRQSFAELG